MPRFRAAFAAFVVGSFAVAVPAVTAPTAAAQAQGACTVGTISGVSVHVKRTRANIRVTPSMRGRFVGVAKPGSFFCQTAKYAAPDGGYWRAGVRIATVDGRFVGGYVFGPLTTQP